MRSSAPKYFTQFSRKSFKTYMIWYLFNRNWVDTRWQHHTTRLQQTIHTIHREYNSGSAGRAPSLRVIPWHLPYNWGKSTEKTSVRVAQYKNNEQAQRTNTIQEQQQAPHKDRSTVQEHEPSQYKNNEQAPDMSDTYFDFRDVSYYFQWNITVHVTLCTFI